MMVVAVHPAVATGPLKHHDADPQPQPQPSRGATTAAASSTASRPREPLAASVTASSASSSLSYSTTISQSPPRNTSNKPSTSMVETSPPALTDEGDQQQCTFAEDAGAAIVESSPPPSSSALAEAVSRTLATRQQQAAPMVVKEKEEAVAEGEAAVTYTSASPPRTPPPPSSPPSQQQRCAPSSCSNRSSSSRDADDGSVVGQHLIGTPPPAGGVGSGSGNEEGGSQQRGNNNAMMSRERQLEERVARLEGTIFALVAMMRNDGGASPSHSAMSSLLEGTPGRDLSMPHLVDAGTGRRSRTPTSGGSPSSSPSCAYDDDGTSPHPALPPPRRGGSTSSERRRRNSTELRARHKSPSSSSSSSSHRAALQQTPPRPPDGRSVPVLDSPSPTPHRRRGGSRSRSGDRRVDRNRDDSSVSVDATTAVLLTTPSLHDSQGDIDYVPSPPSNKPSSSAARSGNRATGRGAAPTVEEGDGSDDSDGRDHDHSSSSSSSSSSDEYPSDDSPRPQEVQHLEYRSFTPDYEEELTRLRQQHRRQFRSASFNDVPMNEEEVEEEEEERRRCSESIYSSISSIGDASGIGGSGSGSGGVGAALVVNDDIVAAARGDDSAPDSEESGDKKLESAAVRPVERSAPAGDAASPSSEVAASSASTSDEAATVTSPSPSTATEQGNGAPPSSRAATGRPGAKETEEDTVKTGVSARTAAQPCPSSRSSSGLPPRHNARVSSSAEKTKKSVRKGRSDTSDSDATTVGASGGGAVAVPAATAAATDPPSAAKSAAAVEDSTRTGAAKVAAIAAGEDDTEAARHLNREKAPLVSPNLARKKDKKEVDDGNGAAAAEVPKARADSIGSNGNKKEPSSAEKAAANAAASAPSSGSQQRPSPSPPTQQSLLSYLKHDLLNIDSRQQDGSATEDVDEHMEEFLLVPSKLERLLFFGLAICTDSFLYLLTLLPLKFLWGCVCFVCTVLRPRRPIWGCRFHRRHLYQILQVVVIYTVYSKVLCPISIGRLYHWIRGQAMIKLYVLIAIVEVFDRLMCSFGQDALDSLYWNTTRRPRHPRMLVSTFVVFAYASMHSMILLVHAATLNVAMNSADQALLTLLVSGNFAEIKSTVFKKYNKQNLFKITTSDICERFKLALFLSLTLLLNCFQGGMDSAMIKNYVHMCGIVLVAEMLADWIKHSFITKFNFIKSSVYPDYSVILAGDVTGIGHEGVNLDHTHAVVKRVGLAQIPLVCVMARYLREAARYAMLDKGEGSQTWAVLATYYMKERWGVMFAISLLFFMLLLAMKIMLGFAINGAARRILDDPTVGDHEEHKKSKKAEEKPLRRRQVV